MVPKYFFFIVLLFFVGKNIYEIGVKNGYLGEYELRKYELQKNKKGGLLSGRGSIFISVLAVIDSPILGHGSYAKDYKGFTYQADHIGNDNISLNKPSSLQTSLIPAHSFLFQAWVFNGIFGALFWLYILFYILIKFLIKFSFKYSIYLAYSLLSVFSLIWDILFSPFQQKPFVAMTIIFLVVLMHKSDKNEI